MKTCPNCKELVGDNVSKCFNCGWNFDDPLENEKAIEREKKRKAEEEERKRSQEEQRIRDEENRKKQEEAAKRETEELERKLQEINDTYKYVVETFRDNDDGSSNIDLIRLFIASYSLKGWRLHTIYTNEIGKVSSMSGVGGITSGTNATINETIIVMERLFRPAKRD